MASNRMKIINAIENLMIKIIKNEIPQRDNLPKNHTLKTMDYWRGGDLCVVSRVEDVPKRDGWYPKDDYLICRSAYEISWVICELRDIYNQNNFYDYSSKYILFGTFANNYMKNYRRLKKADRLWINNQDKWLIDKYFILNALQDLVYSYNHSFLPCDCSNEKNEKDKNCKIDLNHLSTLIIGNS